MVICCGRIVHPQSFTILKIHHAVCALSQDGTKHAAVMDREGQTQAVLHQKW